MLTDLISRCVFSIRISGNSGEDNEFAKLVKELVTPQFDHQSQELLIWSRKLTVKLIFKIYEDWLNMWTNCLYCFFFRRHFSISEKNHEHNNL